MTKISANLLKNGVYARLAEKKVVIAHSERIANNIKRNPVIVSDVSFNEQDMTM